MSQTPSPAEPTDSTDPITAAVAPGYAFEGPALELGGLMLDAGTLDLSTMVTHRLPLAEIEEAMALLSGRANKVLLLPSLD